MSLKLGKNNMTIFQALIAGLLTGGLATSAIVIGLQQRSARLSAIQNNQDETLTKLATINSTIEKGKIDIQKNLTAPDLLSVACSMEYLDNHGDLLCRELFCRLQTREGDGASQAECDSIANMSNSLHILKACNDTVTPEWDRCLAVFDKRK
jgi:hypothetical protein